MAADGSKAPVRPAARAAVRASSRGAVRSEKPFGAAYRETPTVRTCRLIVCLLNCQCSSTDSFDSTLVALVIFTVTPDFPLGKENL